MLKIAVVTSSFPPYKGGMGNTAFHFARGLDRLGHEVHIYTPRYGGKEQKSSEVEEARLIVRYVKPIFSYGKAGVVPQLLYLLKGYDVVHFHFPFVGGTYAVLLARLLYPWKLVVHYHFDLIGRGIFYYIFSTYRFITIPLIAMIADKIIATSRDYLKHSKLAKWEKRNSEKYTVISLGVDFEFFNRDRNIEDIKNKLALSGKSQVVLFVGALDKAHYFKGLAVLLQAWKELSKELSHSATLIVIGKGGLKPSYEVLTDKLKIKSSVIFVGRVPDSDLPPYYQLADITVLPSIDRSEAFGLVLLESMAAGTPVIASDLPGVRSIINHDVGFLVRPNDYNDLARKLVRALGDRKKLNKMGEASEAHAFKFGWERVVSELDRVIKELLLRNESR